MTRQVKVTVNSFGPNRHLALRWKDPISGKRKTRSAGTRVRRDAERLAAKLEDDLRKRRDNPRLPSMELDVFLDRYEKEKLDPDAKKFRASTFTAFNSLQRLCNPRLLSDITAAMLSKFAADLRAEGKARETVRSYLSHLRPALKWAVKLRFLDACPEFPDAPRKKGRKAKGKAINIDAFDRMVLTVEKVRPDDASFWERYLNGLWLSGLRLEESLIFSWDRDADIYIDASRPYWRVHFREGSQKSGKDELWAMPPDLQEWLEKTPQDERLGLVFKLNGLKTRQPISVKRVSEIVCRIGKRAGIVVSEAGDKVKYASAHDLRRSFATRWAPKLMPVDLQRLMRHANIQTTMEFYVEVDADDMATRLREATGVHKLAAPPQNTPTAEWDSYR